jgi:tRNA pseudouridine55 synthase
MEWNGLLLIDKPVNCTSHDVVDRVRRILRMKAVGHAGTLDPLASGLMVLLLGHATKLSNYILAQDKRYWTQVKLGITTDSGDRDGQILSQVPVQVTEKQLHDALEKVVGDLELPVPMVSAIKVKGKKLYEYAREEKPVTAPIKAMRFYDLKLTKWEGDIVEAEISCTKGGYVRSWATELGRQLGIGATVNELRRLESVPYNVHEAVTLEKLAQIVHEGGSLGPAFVPMAQSLPGWTSCIVKGREEQLLRHGQISHDLGNRLIVAQKDAVREGKPVGIKVVGATGELVGLLEALPGEGLKIRRIFSCSGS